MENRTNEIYDSPNGHPISILEIHNPEAARINAYFSSSAAYISPVIIFPSPLKITGINTLGLRRLYAQPTPEEKERNIGILNKDESERKQKCFSVFFRRKSGKRAEREGEGEE